MIKSPYSSIKPKPKPQSVFDLSALLNKMSELDTQIESVKQLKIELQQDHQKTKKQFATEHEAKLQELSSVFGQVKDIASRIQKGDPGQDAEPVDEKALASKVLSMVKVPDPIPGRDAVVDENRIAEKASKLIKIPEAKIPKIDHQEIVDKVFAELDKGKRKLSTKHIGDMTEGMEQYLRPIRSLAAGFRGGGDVVTAGSNITITTDVNGKKVITSSGSATWYQDEVLTRTDGTNYTLAHTPTAVVFLYLNGQLLVGGGQDYTRTGTAIALTSPTIASDTVSATYS